MHRYSTAYVSGIRHDAARTYLTQSGLPAEHVLFRADENLGTFPVLAERSLLAVGVGGPDGVYGIDDDTGEVLFVDVPTREVMYVNASPQSFRAALEAFEGSVAEATDEDPDHLETVAENLRAAIARIDPRATADDLGFWESLIFDVASGDYVEGD